MVELVPLPREAFDSYVAIASEQYADSQVKAGVWPPERAPAMARVEFDHMLPLGIDTPGHHLYAIQDAELGTIGVVWLVVRQRDGGGRLARIYDIWLDPTRRGQGLGGQAVRAVDRVAADLGADSVEVRVFSHDARGQALFESTGYRVVETWYRRDL